MTTELKTTSIRITDPERRAWQARAQAEGCTVSTLIRKAVTARLEGEAAPALSALEASGDWLIHLSTLALKLNTWYPQKTDHSWKDALAWLIDQVGPALAEGRMHLTSRETRVVIEKLEAIGTNLGFRLDQLNEAGAPHSGITELLAFGEGLAAGQLVALNAKEYSKLQEADRY